MKNFGVRDMVACALFAAVTAVLSQVSVPIGPVPLSLGTLAVMLCGMVLGPRNGGIAVGCYILLGLAGVPVFAGFRGGAAVLAGPTGGYIVGYLPYAILCGLGAAGDASFVRRCLFALLGMILCYALGTAFFMASTGSALSAALTACVLPFLPGDAAKILLAAWAAPRLQKALKRR